MEKINVDVVLFVSKTLAFTCNVDGKISAELTLLVCPHNTGLYLLMEELMLTLLCLSIRKTISHTNSSHKKFKKMY